MQILAFITCRKLSKQKHYYDIIIFTPLICSYDGNINCMKISKSFMNAFISVLHEST